VHAKCTLFNNKSSGTVHIITTALQNTCAVRVSGFRREVGEKCALLDYYTVRSGNSLPTFRDKNWNLDL
jgi:hypothetical protein